MSILAAVAPSVNLNPARAANPRDSWPAWTDADVWELGPGPDGGPAPAESGPTAGPDFTPSAWDDAYWLGYTLRLDGHGHAAAPAHYDPLRRVDFYIGQIDGGLEVVRRERAEQLEL